VQVVLYLHHGDISNLCDNVNKIIIVAIHYLHSDT